MTHAKKSLGQNFLHDKTVLEKIISSAEISLADTIVEIGPGHGFLTHALLEKAGQVIAVELDEDLLPSLRANFKDAKNFTLIHKDALEFKPPNEPYKLVANIPYYITSPILNHFLLEQFLSPANSQTHTGNPPQTLVLMVQKEVAEKILALPRHGKQKHSVLSLEVHIFGEPSLVCNVPRSAFTPAPQVDSAVIKIAVRKEPLLLNNKTKNPKDIMRLIHSAFSQKRKKLCNNLGVALHKEPQEIKSILRTLSINEDIRAEDLKMEEWEKLSSHLI